MTLYFLRELSGKSGETYVIDPVEIAWVRQLKQRGLVDAEIGPPVLTQYPTKPARYAIVRGITDAGKTALGIPAFQRLSFWRQLFGRKPAQQAGRSQARQTTEKSMHNPQPPPPGDDQQSMLGEEDPGSAFDPSFHTDSRSQRQPRSPRGMLQVVWSGLVLLLGGLALQRWMAGRDRH